MPKVGGAKRKAVESEKPPEKRSKYKNCEGLAVSGEKKGERKRKTSENDDLGTTKVKHTRTEREDTHDVDENQEHKMATSFSFAKRNINVEPAMVRDLSLELGVDEWRVRNAIALFHEGSTLPFIAR